MCRLFKNGPPNIKSSLEILQKFIWTGGLGFEPMPTAYQYKYYISMPQDFTNTVAYTSYMVTDVPV